MDCGAHTSTPDHVTSTPSLHILIADDHTLVIDMFELFLAQLGDGVRISKATTMPQALAQAKANADLSLALLDLHMPDMDGLTGLRLLREGRPDLPVVIMSGETTPEVAQRVMEAGASGFIPKTIGGQAIIHALRLILSGEQYLPPGLHESKPAPSSGNNIALSPRESEVLRLLVDGRPNKEIARELDIQVVTVTLHLGRIYRKLGVASRTQAVRRAIDLGLDRAP